MDNVHHALIRFLALWLIEAASIVYYSFDPQTESEDKKNASLLGINVSDTSNSTHRG